MMHRSKVLFLCTHNSARSQMAEGLLRHMAGDRFEAYSAGTEATHVRPLAVRAMEEIGVDISSQESKTLARYLPESFAYVITVCDDANEACPFFPGPRRDCTGPWRTLRKPQAPKKSGLRSSGGCGTSFESA